MVTSVIGKIFLQAYNEKNGTNYTPKEFFLKIYYPLFFGHEKYFLWVQNSAIVQKLKNTEMPSKELDKRKSQEQIIEIKKNKLIEKIDNAETFDASMAIGYKAEGTTATTSGQICIHNIRTSPNDAYYSWIGAGLGVGIEGGLVILFYKPELLLDIFDGWNKYRQHLENIPSMKGNQINTWNSQWIKKQYDLIDNSIDFTNEFITKNGIVEVDVLPWTQLLVAISRHFQDPKMMGYVYNIWKTNTTIGFIPFVLQPIRKAHELSKKLFGDEVTNELIQCWKTEYGLKEACKQGIIGLKAMEPKDLEDFIYYQSKKTRKKDKITIYTYQNWLLAMLNNEQLWEESQKIAKLLHTYRQGQGKERTDRDNAIEELLSHPSKFSFIRYISPILKESEDKESVMKICQIINSMPSDNVPYFVGLIRIHYIYITE